MIASHTTYRLTLAEGPAVEVAFAPEIPRGMQIVQVLVNGKMQPPAGCGSLGLLDPPLTFTLEEETTIALHHTGGLGAIPPIPRPEPDDSSQGYRIIHEAMDGEAYALTVEGPSGTTGRFQIKRFDRPLARIDGAERVETSDDGVVTVHVAFDDADESFSRKVVRFIVE